LRRIGGILLAVGLGILMGWGLYWFFRLALSLPLPVKCGTCHTPGVARLGKISGIQRGEGEIQGGAKVIVVTTEQLEGKKITETLGLVRGSTIRARHVGHDLP